MSEAEAKTNLRLPDELYEQIKQMAKEDLRSVNQQMVALLREAVERRRNQSQKDERKP